MNVFLWVIRAVLALLSLSGGAYKVFSFEAVASQPFFGALPRAGWSALGVLEMVLAVLIIVPAATKWRPLLTPLAAAALAVESLALAALYASYSLAPSAENPLSWVVLMAAMAAFVAWGRSPRKPPA